MDTYQTGLHLWERWTAMWNGEPALARQLVAPGFALHLTNPVVDPATVTDGPSVERWVGAHRAKFEQLTFSSKLGPFVDVAKGIVAGPWIARAIIAGKLQPVCGMDTIAFAGGKITAYWTLSNRTESFGDWA